MTFPKKEIQFKVGLRADIVDYLLATPAEEDTRKAGILKKRKIVSTLLESLISETEESSLKVDDEEEENAISETRQLHCTVG